MTTSSPASPDGDPLLRLADMPALLGVRPYTPHQWRYRKELPPPDDTSIPDRPRWRRSTLLAWWSTRPNRGGRALWSRSRVDGPAS